MNPRDSIAATLAALDASAPFALFLRHAEREEIPLETPYADVELTPGGRANAAELGARTALLLRWTATSPFRRCRQTAALLHPGAPEEDARLGAPGPWVIDPVEGANVFAQLGTAGVVRAQLEARAPRAIRDLAGGSRLLLSAALDRIAAGRGAGACVSHDVVLMPALHWLTGGEPGGWLRPLDGFAIQPRGPELLLAWRGQVRAVPP